MRYQVQTLALAICGFALQASAQTMSKPAHFTGVPTIASQAIVQPPSGGFSGGADDCAAADVIAGEGIFGFDTSIATTGVEGQNETLCYDFGMTSVRRDVWYEWTADSSGDATVTMCITGVTADTKIAAYPAGGCPSDGSAIACNDDTCSLQSEISFAVDAGTSYMLQIGHFSAATVGPGTFDIEISSNCICSSYCVAAPNSQSPNGSRISALGSASIADDDLLLRASNAPSQPAIFYYGPNVIEVPFGNGFRCVGGAVSRLPVVFGSGGIFEYQVDMVGDAVTAGTHHFQCWYRDPVAGNAAFNLSDGTIVFIVP
ncbi:MAG: hypothetical protein ACI835_004259 [Planctomycetota bacterium]|jgi:hypothetical protein